MTHIPETCGDALKLLHEHYETEELQTVSRKSGINRQTLKYWHDFPDSPLRAQGREHLRRVFSAQEPAPATAAVPVQSVAIALDGVRDTLALLVHLHESLAAKLDEHEAHLAEVQGMVKDYLTLEAKGRLKKVAGK